MELTILHMFNGEILSFRIDKRPTAKNVMDAMDEAIKITSDCPYRRTFHSDQGWAYQMKAYSYRLKEERIYQSMSNKNEFHLWYGSANATPHGLGINFMDFEIADEYASVECLIHQELDERDAYSGEQN